MKRLAVWTGGAGDGSARRPLDPGTELGVCLRLGRPNCRGRGRTSGAEVGVTPDANQRLPAQSRARREEPSNNGSRPLNAQTSTTRGQRPGGTSRGGCSPWIAAVPASKEPRRRTTTQLPDTTTGMEVTRCSRDRAQGTRRHHRGAGSAGSPGGSGADHTCPSTDARPPGGSCPTDITRVPNRPGRSLLSRSLGEGATNDPDR
jgi:hypothetical protein